MPCGEPVFKQLNVPSVIHTTGFCGAKYLRFRRIGAPPRLNDPRRSEFLLLRLLRQHPRNLTITSTGAIHLDAKHVLFNLKVSTEKFERSRYETSCAFNALDMNHVHQPQQFSQECPNYSEFSGRGTISAVIVLDTRHFMACCPMSCFSVC